MTWTAVAIVLTCQALLVSGQLLLKRAMTPAVERRKGWVFAASIGCLTAWFFLWVGLMSRWELSRLYPFEGLNPALIAVAASVLLKERMPVGAWVGMAMICAGVALVAGS